MYECIIKGAQRDAGRPDLHPGVHASHAVWPGSFWKVPASHCLHVSCLIASVYVPGAHGV